MHARIFTIQIKVTVEKSLRCAMGEKKCDEETHGKKEVGIQSAAWKLHILVAVNDYWLFTYVK